MYVYLIEKCLYLNTKLFIFYKLVGLPTAFIYLTNIVEKDIDYYQLIKFVFIELFITNGNLVYFFLIV